MISFLLIPFLLFGVTFSVEKFKPQAQPKQDKYQPGPKLIDETTRWSKCKSDQNMTIYDFEVDTLDGNYTNLEKFKGQVLLVINVATFCAYTQQYIDFNPLIEKNIANGNQFSILAFPCNQFYLQEPAENHEIMNGITHVRPGNGWKPHPRLNIYGKLEVNGANQHPLYEFLKDSCPQTVPQIGKREELMYNPIRVNDITWNFEASCEGIIENKCLPEIPHRFRGPSALSVPPDRLVPRRSCAEIHRPIGVRASERSAGRSEKVVKGPNFTIFNCFQ